MLPQTSTALLAEYERCDAHIKEQQRVRSATMARASEIVRELAVRGEALDGMSERVKSIGQRYKTVDRELNDVMTTGVRTVGQRQGPSGARPMLARPSSLTGHYIQSVRSEGVRQANISCQDVPMIGPRPIQAQRPSDTGPSYSAQSLQVNSKASARTVEVGTKLIRQPKRTRYCGKIIEKPQYIVRRRYEDLGGLLFCVICSKRFVEHGDLFYHFSGCAKDRGNEMGYSWYNHPTIKKSEIPDSLMEDVSDKAILQCIWVLNQYRSSFKIASYHGQRYRLSSLDGQCDEWTVISP